MESVGFCKLCMFDALEKAKEEVLHTAFTADARITHAIRMLLIGMWMSFTKKPMKPMTRNPTVVALATCMNSA